MEAGRRNATVYLVCVFVCLCIRTCTMVVCLSPFCWPSASIQFSVSTSHHALSMLVLQMCAVASAFFVGSGAWPHYQAASIFMSAEPAPQFQQDINLSASIIISTASDIKPFFFKCGGLLILPVC